MLSFKNNSSKNKTLTKKEQKEVYQRTRLINGNKNNFGLLFHFDNLHNIKSTSKDYTFYINQLARLEKIINKGLINKKQIDTAAKVVSYDFIRYEYDK